MALESLAKAVSPLPPWLLEDFTRQSHRFNGYRAMIAAEPAQFVDDARQAFPIEVRL